MNEPAGDTWLGARPVVGTQGPEVGKRKQGSGSGQRRGRAWVSLRRGRRAWGLILMGKGSPGRSTEGPAG